MRVLVTGHDGYIGTVLTPMLKAAGHEVVGLDSRLFDGCVFGEIPEVETISMDVRELADDSFSPVFLRNATAYGISPRQRGDLVIPNLTAYAYCTGEVKLESDGSPWRPLAHIEDISGAMIAALEAPRDSIHNEAFNVGRNEDNYQIRDIAKMVERTVPDSRVTLAEGASPDKRSYRVSFDKITSSLPGFEAKWTVERGVQQAYEAFRDANLELDDFLSSRFIRLKRVQELIDAGEVDGSSLRRTAAVGA